MSEPAGQEAEVAAGALPSPTQAIVTVVLIDDHVQLADAVARTLGEHARIEVLAVAGTCAAGLRAVARHRPDVCLLDQRLPDGLGTDLLPDLHAVNAATKVLVMTGDDSAEVIREALQGGSVGVLGKGLRARALRAAVLSAAAGGMVPGDTVRGDEDLLPLPPRAVDAAHRPEDHPSPSGEDMPQ